MQHEDLLKGEQGVSRLEIEDINMTNSMKVEEKIEGASNYKACKKRIDLIL